MPPTHNPSCGTSMDIPGRETTCEGSLLEDRILSKTSEQVFPDEASCCIPTRHPSHSDSSSRQGRWHKLQLGANRLFNTGVELSGRRSDFKTELERMRRRSLGAVLRRNMQKAPVFSLVAENLTVEPSTRLEYVRKTQPSFPFHTNSTREKAENDERRVAEKALLSHRSGQSMCPVNTGRRSLGEVESGSNLTTGRYPWSPV